MWNNIKQIKSKETSVCKFVYEKVDAVAESVLYKYPTYQERTVICCSTQSGCPVGCRFCGAGDHFVRSLTSEEIVSQVVHSMLQTGVDASSIKKLQIMFMSMGEPLLNFNALNKAINVLSIIYPYAQLLISTIGPKIEYSSLIRLSIAIPAVGLQFSIHESTDEARNKLIPLKGKLSLEKIANVGNLWAKETGRKPFFNYCASDHNTSLADAKRLEKLFSPKIWQATISVICERGEGLEAKNDHQVGLAKSFSEKMLNIGYNVRVFDPAGQDDIGGGCGQLWWVQKWMEEHPDKVKDSVGHDIPVIHVPC